MNRKRKLVEKILAIPTEAKFEDVRLLLEMFGFEEKRSTGSHHVFQKSQTRSITIPKKSGKKVKRPYLKEIVELLDLQAWRDEQDGQSEDESESE